MCCYVEEQGSKHVYLEEEGFDLATVPTHLLRVLRIEKAPGWYPGIRHTLVVAKQPHKHIWKGVLRLEEVAQINTHTHTHTHEQHNAL